MKVNDEGRIVLDFKPGVIEEIWKPLERFEVGGAMYEPMYRYDISSYGNVKCNGVLVPQSPNMDGYPHIKIWLISMDYKPVRKSLSVHRLVAVTFIPNEEGKSEVNHKNRRRCMPNYYNLEWCTRSENMFHVYTKASSKDKKTGENNIKAKYTDNQIAYVCDLIAKGLTNREVIENCDFFEYGDIRQVYRIRSGEIWPHISEKYTFPKLPITKTIPHEYILNLVEVNQIKKMRIDNVSFRDIINTFPKLAYYGAPDNVIKKIMKGKYKNV